MVPFDIRVCFYLLMRYTVMQHEKREAVSQLTLKTESVCSIIILMEICKASTPAAQSSEQAYYDTHNVHRDGKC